MEKNYYVYMWYFKSSNEVFYIGKGTRSRYLETNYRNDYFKSIINKYSDDVAVKKIIENLTNEESCILERILIKKYKDIGQCKANFHEGGLGGNTGNYEQVSLKLKEYYKNNDNTSVNNHNYGKHWDDEKRLEQSNKLKIAWSNPEIRKRFMQNRTNTGFKRGVKPWNTGKKYTLGKQTEEHYLHMMLVDCKYKYEVYFNDVLIYWCLGHTHLHNFCKETFNISRTIVEQIIRNEWIPKFNKHKHLSTLKIIAIDRSVTTNSDECSCVEWRLQPLEVPGNSN